MCVCASRIYVQICSTISNSQPWNSPIIGSSSFLAVKSLKDRGESQQNGVAVQRERERESPQTWSVTLNINGILLFTPREAFLEGNCKSFWFPMKENILKEPCLCGAYSSCHRAKGRVTPGTTRQACGRRTHTSKVRTCRLYRDHQSARNIAQYVI